MKPRKNFPGKKFERLCYVTGWIGRNYGSFRKLARLLEYTSKPSTQIADINPREKIEKFPEKGNQRLRYDTGEDGQYLGQGARFRQLGRFPGLLRQELKVLRSGRPCLLDHRSQRGGS